MENKPKQNEIKIELTPEVANGHYSNLAVVSHSPNEFIMTPENVKNLAAALVDNVKKYEATFGPIEHKQPRKATGEIPNPFINGAKA